MRRCLVPRIMLVTVWSCHLFWATEAPAQPRAAPITVLPGAESQVVPSGQPIKPDPPSRQSSLSAPGPVGLLDSSPAATDGPLLTTPDSAGQSWPGATLAPWTWQLLPDSLMYKSYLAGPREPRLGNQWVHEERLGWLWDATLGARVGLIRYGTQDPLWPEGWQLDVEGAAFPRLDADRNLISADFRVGVPLTTRMGPWEAKLAYYHLSSHLADEFMLLTGDFDRINYVRDAAVLGAAFHPSPDWRLYGEAGWAFKTDGGAKPWEFQFGVEYSPAQPTGFYGAPFLAVNGLLREEVDYGGSLTAQAGWLWRGPNAHLTRLGVHYFNGKSEQRQFLHSFEEQIGVGLWYDF